MVLRTGLACTLLVVAACAACEGDGTLERSELKITAVGWYRVGTWLLGPTTCLTNSSTAYLLDGETIPPSGVCGALTAQQTADRTFTIGVRYGEEEGQIVVTGMFPGLAASVIDPPGGPVSAGGKIIVQVPPAAQPSTLYRAWFEYLDNDDPLYTGENAFLSDVPAADAVHVTAPAHPGHFMLRLEMTTAGGPAPAATILSCTGLRRCSAQAAIDLGPMAIEVTPS